MNAPPQEDNPSEQVSRLAEANVASEQVVAALASATNNGLEHGQQRVKCTSELTLVVGQASLASKQHKLQSATNCIDWPGQESKAEMARRIAKQQKKWNKRLKIFFCCLGYKKNKVSVSIASARRPGPVGSVASCAEQTNSKSNSLPFYIQDSIADVASIFAEFYADLRVPSSDIAAGFVLLSKYQAAQRQWTLMEGRKFIKDQQGAESSPIEQYLSGIPIRSDTKFLDLSVAEDSHLINDLIYYLNYSLAIFGWPMHMVDDPCLLCCIYPYLKVSPCCKLRKTRHSTGCARVKTTKRASDRDKESDGKRRAPDEVEAEREELGEEESERLKCCERLPERRVGELDRHCDIPIVLEDNCCSCNLASAERRLASHNYEIIYVSYKVNVNVVPFLVAADHSKRAIVVAIRGSMSLSDMVTDMNGQIDKMPVEGCPDDWLCHRGITRAAMYVKLTLEQERIIERALSCRPDLGSEHYNLVLCGHSLGAGAAAILGVLMRSQYPNLKAYLYSPPGGILSMPVVEYTKQFATGVILGNDTVARLGVAQLERLRYHTLLSIKSAQKSTSKILAKALCPTSCFGDNKVDYDPSQSLDLLHGTEGRAFEYSGTTILFQSQPQVLYVPGRLVHVVKNYSFQSPAKGARSKADGTTRRCSSSRSGRFWMRGPIYQAVWTDNAMYDRVLISEGMFFDHLPNKLMEAMKLLFCKTLPARQESRSSSSLVAEQTSVGLQCAQQEPVPKVNSSAREAPLEGYDCKKIDPIEQVEDKDENNNNNNPIDGKAFPNLNNMSLQSEQQMKHVYNRRDLEEVITKEERKEGERSLDGDVNSGTRQSVQMISGVFAGKLCLDENGNEQD